jgi:hypothetical protein
VRVRVAALVVVAAAVVVGLTGCEQVQVFATQLDTSWGDDGLQTIEAPTNLLRTALTPDGGLLVLDGSSLGRLDRTGSPAAGWVPPTLPSPVDALAALPGGGVVAVVTEGGKRVVGWWDATGTRIAAATKVLPNTNFRSTGVSAFGRLATVSQSCASGTTCSTFIVSAFEPNGVLRYETTVDVSAGGGSPCGYGVGSRAILPHDDGTTTVAIARCSTDGGSTSSRTVVRRLLADGTVDATYGAGAGYGVIATSSTSIVISPNKQVLAMTGSYGLSRLTPVGVADATFGNRSGLTYTGGVGVGSLVPNGNGYIIAGYVSGPACDPTGTLTFRFVGPDGATKQTVTAPMSIGDASVARYPNGDLMVRGLSQASEVQGTSTLCVAPRTYRFLRYTTPVPGIPS